MVKNSFTLVELLLSISILAFLSAYVLYSKKDFSKEYKLLNHLENKFTSKNYENLDTNSVNLDIYINDELKQQNVKKIEYKDENIKIFKYEL